MFSWGIYNFTGGFRAAGAALVLVMQFYRGIKRDFISQAGMKTSAVCQTSGNSSKTNDSKEPSNKPKVVQTFKQCLETAHCWLSSSSGLQGRLLCCSAVRATAQASDPVSMQFVECVS